MTEFKSNPVLINTPEEHIYNFLIDFNNFEKLMPEQIVQWKSTIGSCSFTIQGMADLALVMGEKREYSLVTYNSAEPSPFDFYLQFTIEKENTGSAVSCILKARLSPMIKMMASRPLQNFVTILAEKLKLEMEKGFSAV
jgi:carbon monoxide dehydrogenase subunit G